MIQDVGEYIPFAKKETPPQSAGGVVDSKGAETKAITLKSLWPEPDWIAKYIDGIPVEVLANLYGIYHGLAKKPHVTDRYSFSGVKITPEMWETAYIEAIQYIRQACENVSTVQCINELTGSFNEYFDIEGERSFKTYAAGTRTPRTFYHPLGNDRGTSSQYKKILPLLDWPLGVNAKKIPYFPIELIHKKTKVHSFSLGKHNKKSVSWHNNKGYKNEFETYEDAVAALIEHHGEEFTIEESKRKAVEIYFPKKDSSKMQGVDDSYPERTAEDLMHRYGFRGIQFGNYVSQKERQAYINNIYHSLGLLTQLLKTKVKWIGGGQLGLAIGARGNGYAAAHYEIDLHVINLTRFNGIGSIAHELFHAFDARMAKACLGRADLLSNLIASNYVGVDDVESKHRARFLAFSDLVNACTQKSNFTKNAASLESQKGAAKYWTKPSELCARAFESFAQDALEFNQIHNQWLALGTKETDYASNGMHPYPTGNDRKRINSVLSKTLPVVFG